MNHLSASRGEAFSSSAMSKELSIVLSDHTVSSSSPAPRKVSLKEKTICICPSYGDFQHLKKHNKNQTITTTTYKNPGPQDNCTSHLFDHIASECDSGK